MGTFIFTWEHPADEVYVTGTFDNWSKSERLNKKDQIFSKKVFLPNASEKIYYKFVVDGNWVTDHTAPQEKDESGNLNNILTTDRIIKEFPETTPIMSGNTPDSTTAALASAVPLEDDKKIDSTILPGTFPETPGITEKSEGEFSMTRPSTQQTPSKLAQINLTEALSKTSNTADDNPGILSGASDEKDHTFRISPLPDFPGAVNPISIAPGQKLPDYSELTSNTLTSSVNLGKQPHDPPSTVTTQSENDFKPLYNLSIDENPEVDKQKLSSSINSDNNGLNDVTLVQPADPQNNTAIPADEVPIHDSNKLSNLHESTNESTTGPLLQSVGPQSTTATLAGEVPKDGSVKQTNLDDSATESIARALVQSAGPQSTVATLAGDVPIHDLVKQLNLLEPDNNPITNPLVQSAGPQSTTATLAGEVPKDGSVKQSELFDSTAEDIAKTLIQSAGPQSTTAALAGEVPLEISTETPFIQTTVENILSSTSASERSRNLAEPSYESLKSEDKHFTAEHVPFKTGSTSIDGKESIESETNSKVESNEKILMPKNQAEKELSAEVKFGVSSDGSAPTNSSVTSDQKNNSNHINPNTVTTIISSDAEHKPDNDIPPIATTAELDPSMSHQPPAESSSNNLLGPEKMDKKKKRASFFSKLKAKLIYKDRD